MRHAAACERQSLEFTELWQASFKKPLSTMPVRLAAGGPAPQPESAYQEFGISPAEYAYRKFFVCPGMLKVYIAWWLNGFGAWRDRFANARPGISIEENCGMRL